MIKIKILVMNNIIYQIPVTKSAFDDQKYIHSVLTRGYSVACIRKGRLGIHS